MPFHGKQIQDATVTKAKLSLVDPTGNLDPVTRQYLEAYVSAQIALKSWKDPVRVVALTNITISAPGASIDGITMTNGDRVLLAAETAGATNGIYIFNGAAVAMTRATDFDSSAEAIDGSLIPIQQGTSAGKFFEMTTDAPITLGTTSLTFSAYNPAGTAPVPTTLDKDLACSLTTTDFDVACNTGLTNTPAQGGYVLVQLNGVQITIGDAVKTKEAYFSGNTGTTARALNAIVAGDKLYWVGSVSGYQLATTDRVSYMYNV